MNLPTCISSNRKIRYTVCFVVLVALLVIFFTISVCAGSVQISISDILRQFRGEQDELYATILFQIRIPRTFAAILLGGALALSGYLLQTFFHNPIAGPFVLGISSGAKLFVAVVMIVFLRYSRTLSSVDLIVAAFAGSMLSMFCVLLMSPRVQNMSFLVLIGVMIGYICSAVTDFLVTFAEDSDIVNLHNWSMGSFSGITWENVKTIVFVVAVTGHFDILFVKTDGSVPVRRDLCKKYGCQYQNVPRIARDLIEHLIRSGNNVCRTCVVCRDCGAADGKAVIPDGKTDHHDTGMFFRWGSILHVL